MKTAPGSAGNTTEGLPNPMHPERTTPMVDDQQDHAQGKRGIPTMYAGTLFRSRHEARWAAMFDLAGWAWTFEPFDGSGYIPDFLIHGGSPFLVEVKPATTGAEYEAPIPKIVDGIGHLWTHDVLIVGLGVARMFDVAGILVDFLHGPDDWHTSDARWVYCPECTALGVVTEQASGHIRPCGHVAPKGAPYDHDRLMKAWATAGNLVQWKAAS